MQDPLQQKPPPPIDFNSGASPQSSFPNPPAPLVAPPLAPEEDDGWGVIGIVMVALAVLFAGGVVFFIATSGEDEGELPKQESQAKVGEGEGASVDKDKEKSKAAETEGEQPEKVAVAEPSSKNTGLEAADEFKKIADAGGAVVADAGGPLVGEGTPGGTAAIRANGEIDRPAGLISLSIESEPPGADVIRKQDGVRLGTTPYRYEVEAERGKVAFVLKKEGYKSASVSMPADRDGVRQVMLLPGKGGVAVPEAKAPIDSVETSVSEPPEPPKKQAAKAKTVAKKSQAKARRKASKKSKKHRPATKEEKAKKPSGTVDYAADPIPL